MIGEDITPAESDGAINGTENLTEACDSGNHIEIEKKYLLDGYGIFSKVMERLKEQNKYELEEQGTQRQTDDYYDTPDRYLFNNNSILRITQKGNKYRLTVKKPTVGKNAGEQSERYEYEAPVSSRTLTDSREHVVKYLPELSDDRSWDKLNKTLTIIKNRTRIILQHSGIKFEVAFDDVTYINQSTGKAAGDYQLEIELKSDRLHRVELKLLTDYLEDGISGLTATSESKYKRGLRLTE